MGNSSSRQEAAKAKNRPPDIEQSHPEFKNFIEVASGFWNHRVDFYVLKNKVNIKSHMSVARLSTGDFVSIDAAAFSPEAKEEFDRLTDNGERLVGCLHTHPFHTLAIPAFHAAYPATERRLYFGCPRHLRNITEDSSGAPIVWSGDLKECDAQKKFLPDLEMRIPAGAEFDDPKPPAHNHFSNVFVFHPASKVVVNDDTVMYFGEVEGFLFKYVLRIKPFTMKFHTSMMSVGLRPTPEAPLEFLAWFQKMLDDWDFEHLISAHTDGCYNTAKADARALLSAADPKLKALSEKNRKAASKKKGGEDKPETTSSEPEGFCPDPEQYECG